MSEEIVLNENDKTGQEVNKVEQLGERVAATKEQLLEELNYYIENHNQYLSYIGRTGINDEDTDAVLLGPGLLAKIEMWYGLARKEAYAIAGTCRNLQKFYLAAAEQGKSNQYERVRLRQYHKDMSSATDAKEVARRIGGRLEERAARWEGEYLRWHGAGDSYEQVGNSVKDLYKLAEYEWQLSKKS
jgi:hypothetical protein